MENQKTFEQNILDELAKTGFPTEIIAARVMQDNKWAVIHNPSYLDDTEKISREFDIRALMTQSFKHYPRDINITYHLITECKKSDKPWVFFTTPKRTRSGRLGNPIKFSMSGVPPFTSNRSSKSVIADEHLERFHHYFKSKRLARTFHEPFKKKDGTEHTQMIYSAIMSVVKATLFHLQQSSEYRLKIYYPLIIFNGNLFDACINPNDEIVLRKTEHIRLSFNYISNHPSQNHGEENIHEFIIDVIQADYLNKFLHDLEKELHNLVVHYETGLKNSP